MVIAGDQPTAALHALLMADGLLESASRLANDDFAPYEAAEQLRAAGHVIAAIADALYAHALSPPFPRPSRTQIKAAVKAFERDADASPAWNAI